MSHVRSPSSAHLTLYYLCAFSSLLLNWRNSLKTPEVSGTRGCLGSLGLTHTLSHSLQHLLATLEAPMRQGLNALRVYWAGPLDEAGGASRKQACGPQPGIVWVPTAGSYSSALRGLSGGASEGLQEAQSLTSHGARGTDTPSLSCEKGKPSDWQEIPEWQRNSFLMSWLVVFSKIVPEASLLSHPLIPKIIYRHTANVQPQRDVTRPPGF